MVESSARPDDLDVYVDEADEQVGRLQRRAGDLKDALDRFRGSNGRSAFVADVPELDLPVMSFAGRWEGVADHLGSVATAFRDADDSGDVVTVPDSVLDAVVGRSQPEEAHVRVDGDGRLIVDSGVGDDEITVTYEGLLGAVMVVRVNGEEIYRGRPDQELVLLGGPGDDTIEVAEPPRWMSDPPPLTVEAGGGDNTVWSRYPDAVVRAGDGDNTIWAFGEDSTIVAGDGDNEITGSFGRDTIIVGDGDNTIRAGGPLGLGGGDNYVRAGDGNNTIHGGRGNDEIHTGTGDDVIRPGGGVNTVTSRGGNNEIHLRGDSNHVTTGDGNDTIWGGEGSDTVVTSGGDNYIQMTSGRNSITTGGGDDTIYGGDGNDTIRTEGGDNYISGGMDGTNRIFSGDGNDIISGGAGNDTIFPGGGNNVVYSGPGENTIFAGRGDNTIYAQDSDHILGGGPDDTIHHVEIDLDLIDESIEFEDGTPASYENRVRADLVTLASSPTGQAMLQELADAGQPITIVETDDGNVHRPGDHEIGYNPGRLNPGSGPRPPIIGLHHEMVHAYNNVTDTYVEGSYLGPDLPPLLRVENGGGQLENFDMRNIDADGDGLVAEAEIEAIAAQHPGFDADDIHGALTPNRERQAVGLPVTPPDSDGDYATGEVNAASVTDPPHHHVLTENQLRNEMLSLQQPGSWRRERYGSAG